MPVDATKDLQIKGFPSRRSRVRPPSSASTNALLMDRFGRFGDLAGAKVAWSRGASVWYRSRVPNGVRAGLRSAHNPEGPPALRGPRAAARHSQPGSLDALCVGALCCHAGLDLPQSGMRPTVTRMRRLLVIALVFVGLS